MNNADPRHDENLKRARLALEGLSVGDGFGGFLEFRAMPVWQFEKRVLPPIQWRYTDDTNMALSIYEILRRYGKVDQDALAQSFADHFDGTRGYGMGARSLLKKVKAGESWRKVSKTLFGNGSFGNGGAMRVAPLGAYYAEMPVNVVFEQAALSAEITHAHHEGIVGAAAVAIGTAMAWRCAQETEILSPPEFLDLMLPHLPASDVRNGIETARGLPADVTVKDAVRALGNGKQVSAQDTVPFALWCAATHLNSFEDAIWNAASTGGDTDTICAMVGGIVAMSATIPENWIQQREPLPEWALSL